jgi:hypothetical protein
MQEFNYYTNCYNLKDFLHDLCNLEIVNEFNFDLDSLIVADRIVISLFVKVMLMSSNF